MNEPREDIGESTITLPDPQGALRSAFYARAGVLLLLGALGGLQGVIGWWMVSSGVTSGTSIVTVASTRLAIHLGLAFVIMGFITWFALSLGRPERDPAPDSEVPGCGIRVQHGPRDPWLTPEHDRARRP